MSELKTTSWNPFTGCTKVSPACKNCYAETLASKLYKWGTKGYENEFEFTVHSDRIYNAPPLKRKKPTLYFINNMSDTFHEDARFEQIDQIIDVVQKCHHHNFYMLTKRSERMNTYFKSRDIPKNLWLGVTVENKKYGIPRLKDLREINTPNRHLCCEPLLEDLGDIDLSGIKLVVGGGESGTDARPSNILWVESLLKSCEKYRTEFYWKSWGSHNQYGQRARKTGCLINGKEYKSFPIEIMPGTQIQARLL